MSYEHRCVSSLVVAAILAAATMAVSTASADTYTDPVIDRTAGGQAVGYATSDGE